MPVASIRAPLALLAASALACRPAEPPPPPAPPPFTPLVYAAPAGPAPEPAAIESGVLAKGDSLGKALGRLHVDARAVDELAGAIKDGPLSVGGQACLPGTQCTDFQWKRARPGDHFDLLRDGEGRIEWFRFTAGPTTILHAYRGPDGVLRGVKEQIRVVTSTVFVAGEVHHSLYGAMETAGESPRLTLDFVDLFAWDIDFYTESQPGDRFRMVLEKRFVDGSFVGYGRILGGEYRMANGKRHQAFHYVHKDGTPGYYTADGGSVRKSFLKSPLVFSTITSRFGIRKHPILEYVGTHKGIDYAAPMGTSVWAVGDGTVTWAGPNGGYGNVVFVRHTNGLETRYAHLRGFGKGVRSGRHVTQKEVVGYVGMTGLATGPHLHFEVLRNGHHLNPLSVAVPPAPPIAPEELPDFARAIAPSKLALAQGSWLASGE